MLVLLGLVFPSYVSLGQDISGYFVLGHVMSG